MELMIKFNDRIVCTSYVAYPKEILIDMMQNGYVIYQDGKKLLRKDVK